MNQVLIVEDDKDLAGLLSIHLKDMECEVDVVHDGLEGFQKAMDKAYNLILLDVMLPGMDGVAVCQKIRALENYTPIMMLTAKSEEFDKVMGLESGADDYMTKPFGVREFIARVKAILRRQKQNQNLIKDGQNTNIKIGGLEIDMEKRKVTVNGTRVDLTPKEFDLLALMSNNKGRSYDRNQLLSLVWGYEFSGYEHTVNSHINRLRAKIEPDQNNPTYILTTWGIGYRFNDEL